MKAPAALALALCTTRRLVRILFGANCALVTASGVSAVPAVPTVPLFSISMASYSRQSDGRWQVTVTDAGIRHKGVVLRYKEKPVVQLNILSLDTHSSHARPRMSSSIFLPPDLNSREANL